MKTFVDLLNRKYLEYQNRLGRPAKAKEFAAYLGVPPTSYSNWINSGVVPSMEYAYRLADKLGPEVLDVLGFARPTPTLPIDQLPQVIQDLLQSFVSDVSRELEGKDPESVEAQEIVMRLLESHGMTFISKTESQPGTENK